ncbi:MAG TPA: hypothetical protein VGJ94_17260 [Syntrophorhabdaceae bacterium]
MKIMNGRAGRCSAMGKIAAALIFGFVALIMSTTPVLSKGSHGGGHGPYQKGYSHGHHYGRYPHGHGYYRPGAVYYPPPPVVYAPPPVVYVPPPSAGINLVFPIKIH